MAENEIPFSIGIEVFARLQKLEEGLKQAEKTIERQSGKIAQKAAELGKKAGKAAADEFAKAFAKIQDDIQEQLEKTERQFLLKLYKMEAARKDAQDVAAQRNQFDAGENRQMQNELAMAHTPNMHGSGSGGGRGRGLGGGSAAAGAAGAKMARSLKAGMGRILGVAAGVGLADMLLEGIIKGIRDEDTSIGMAVGESVAGAMRSIPVAGALGELASMAFDPLFGGPLAAEAEQKKSREEAVANMEKQARLDARKQAAAERMGQADVFVADAANRIKGIKAEADLLRSGDAMDRARGKFAETDFESNEDIAASANKLFAKQQETYEKQKAAAEATLAIEKEKIKSREGMFEKERKAAIEIAEAEHVLQIENLRLQHEAANRNLDELEQSKQDALKQRMELEEQQAIAVRESFVQAQEGMQVMKQQAQLSAARQTSTFSTAGGSFTTAAIAQVNELKVLRAAVEKFPVLLAKIAVNTAMGGVSLR